MFTWNTISGLTQVSPNTWIPNCYSMWYLTLNKGQFPSHFQIMIPGRVIQQSLIKCNNLIFVTEYRNKTEQVSTIWIPDVTIFQILTVLRVYGNNYKFFFHEYKNVWSIFWRVSFAHFYQFWGKNYFDERHFGQKSPPTFYYFLLTSGKKS